MPFISVFYVSHVAGNEGKVLQQVITLCIMKIFNYKLYKLFTDHIQIYQSN